MFPVFGSTIFSVLRSVTAAKHIALFLLMVMVNVSRENIKCEKKLNCIKNHSRPFEFSFFVIERNNHARQRMGHRVN